MYDLFFIRNTPFIVEIDWAFTLCHYLQRIAKILKTLAWLNPTLNNLFYQGTDFSCWRFDRWWLGMFLKCFFWKHLGSIKLWECLSALSSLRPSVLSKFLALPPYHSPYFYNFSQFCLSLQLSLNLFAVLYNNNCS